jgi:hypothetical protein
MLKLKLFGVLGASATVWAMWAWAQEAPSTPNHSTEELAGLMRAKLASSQKVVEGLMAKDFAMIRKGSEEMSKVCDATQWHATEDQVYAHYRAELKRTAKKLILLAEENNLDGTAYTYMHSLTTCISCHEYCRDVLHIAAKEPELKVVPIPASERESNSNPTPTFRR